MEQHKAQQHLNILRARVSSVSKFLDVLVLASPGGLVPSFEMHILRCSQFSDSNYPTGNCRDVLLGVASL